MPLVPQRELSYGEKMENFHKARKRQEEQQAKPKQKRQAKQKQRPEYSYPEVMERIRAIGKESS